MSDKESNEEDVFFNPFRKLQGELGKKAPPAPGPAAVPEVKKRPAGPGRNVDDAALFLQAVSSPGFKPIKDSAPPPGVQSGTRANTRPGPDRPEKQAGETAKAEVPQPAQAAKKAEPEKPAVAEAELDLFASAMQGVKPVDGKGRDLTPPRPEPKINMLEDPDYLQDFLQGKVEFSLEYTDEFFEGHVMGLDPLVLAKLRSGQYSPESHIDLHGQNAEQALEALTTFIRHAYNKGQRSLVVVTGRGKNSPGGLSILRQHMQDWLTRDPLKRVVLAFCTAQPKDGGAGAIYVLLRKYKKSGKIRWDRS